MYEGSSPVSGRFVVEESVGGEGEVVRRLMFMSAPQLAQTEVRMVTGWWGEGKEGRREGGREERDTHAYTCCDTHTYTHTHTHTHTHTYTYTHTTLPLPSPLLQ